VVDQEIKKLAAQSHEAVTRSSEILSSIESGVSQVVTAVIEEKKAVIHGIDEMQVVKDKIDKIFSLILNVNTLVTSATDATKQQSALASDSTTSLGEVVELVNGTRISVEHTLEQMKKQRHEVSMLQRINTLSGAYIGHSGYRITQARVHGGCEYFRYEADIELIGART
jgi:methyl-accepting chemotaxis protein